MKPKKNLRYNKLTFILNIILKIQLKINKDQILLNN